MHSPASALTDVRSPSGGDDVAGRVDDPRWVRLAMTALLVATAALWSAGLSANGWANSYYSAAVQAGTKSWKAFLFGSSDAANSITVDKPPASLWLMEVAARIFGVNTWSIQLPQVLLGVASVGLLYVIVGKQFGSAAGLIAGAVLAVTPVATLMFRYNNPDALLVFLMIAAVWALMRAVDDGHTGWVLLCGALIGFGFLTKQLQVMLVVPGLALTYLITGPVKMGKRIAQLVAGLAAIVAAAGWWVLLVELTPADQRPYIGGSTDNSFLNLTLGYNGIFRLAAGATGAVPVSFPISDGSGPRPFGHAGLTRMFTGEAGGQISWLLPAALIFVVAGLVLCGRARRTNPQRAQYLVWGGWLLGTAGVFSLMSGPFHDYYTVALAPAVAALVGIGSVHLWRSRRAPWVGLVLVLTAALSSVWAWVLLARTPDFVPWLRWIVLAAGVGGTLAMSVGFVLPAVTSRRGDIARWAAALAGAAVIAGPVSYSIQTISTSHTGGIIAAGPSVKGAGGLPVDSASGSPSVGFGADAGPPGMGPTVVSSAVTRLVSRHAENYMWAAAINGSTNAADYQLGTDDPIMPIGGFGSFDPSPTLEQFQRYVAEHRIHYYIESPMHGWPGSNGNATPGVGRPDTAGQTSVLLQQDIEERTQADRIAAWVKQHYSPMTVDGVTLYDLTSPTT